MDCDHIQKMISKANKSDKDKIKRGLFYFSKDLKADQPSYLGLDKDALA